MRNIIILISILLTGCGSSSDKEEVAAPVVESEPQAPTQTVTKQQEPEVIVEYIFIEVEPEPEPEPVKIRHDFTALSHLSQSPYVATILPDKAVTMSIELIRGDISCNGHCELPLTGYKATMFNIDTDQLLTDVKITSVSKSFICYEMASGWYVVNYHYQGRSWWVEAIESCYHGTYEIDPSQWEWDGVTSAFVDVRGNGNWIFNAE